MNTTDLRKKVHEIIDSSDDEIIQAVYTLLQTNDSEHILGTTVEQYNKEIDEAVTRVEAGEFYSQGEVEQMSKEW